VNDTKQKRGSNLRHRSGTEGNSAMTNKYEMHVSQRVRLLNEAIYRVAPRVSTVSLEDKKEPL